MAQGVILAKPPTGEQGAQSTLQAIPSYAALSIGDELERTPELMWPQSVWTYAGMANDTQLEGLMAGSTLPIRRYKWQIDAQECDPEKVALLAADMNLPIKGKDNQPRRRSRDRFSHDRLLFHALKALQYGHYFLEQVAEVQDDGLAHLKKAAPRPPFTIAEVATNDAGGLKYIKQNVGRAYGQAREIAADRVLAYVWDQEGSNWFGRSMFRACYRNFVVKDRLIRVDGVKHERNGLGVPLGIGAPGMGRTDLAKLAQQAQQWKVGEGAGGAVPNGADIKLVGVSGQIPDTIASIRLHNEEMARRFLMMFMQLGESAHGNRALGESFINFFTMYQDTIANWYADTTTEHLIEDWWDWNVDPGSDVTPRLTYEKSNDPRDAYGPFANLVQTGAIQVDDEIENAIREAMDLPTRTKPRIEAELPASAGGPGQVPGQGDGGKADPTQSSGGETKAASKRQERAVRADGAATSPATLPLPSRPLRRQPSEVELSANINFAELDFVWQSRLDQLFDQWQNEVTSTQIDALHAQISKTADLEKLVSIEAPAIGADVLRAAMLDMYHEGVRLATDEAKAQGHEIMEPHPDDYTSNFLARAKAVDESNARVISNMAGTRALRMSGGTLNRQEVADHTRDYLGALKFAMLRDRLGGALTAAVNTGRRAVMAEGPAARYYASEILDNNTCSPCAGVDGRQYNTLSESEQDYPGGGFVDCSGGDRCRGTLVAVYVEGNEEAFA
jgi:hypothetical protein